MNGKGLDIAFEILFGELNKLLDIISEEGEKAFRDKDFEKVKKLIDVGEKLKSFRKNLEFSREE